MRCKECQRDGKHSHLQQQQQQQLKPIFKKSSQFQPISLSQRYAIIILHLLQKYNNQQISQIVNCHEKTVKRWIHHFEAAEKFDDEAVSDFPREGHTYIYTHTHTKHSRSYLYCQ